MAMIGRPAARAPLSTADITDGTITSAHIQSDALTHADLAPNSVTNSEMSDDAVGIAELSATGTAGATTFLRGDNTWTVVDTEGTGIKSTGESGGDKFLREDGDGTSSWQVAGSPSIDDGGNATAMTIDSAEDVTFAKRAIIPSLKPVSNQNLTGTYSDHEMIIGDQFTLTGDLTINDNLVLASLSGSGQDITITDDGNGRTITTAGKVLSCTTTNTDATVTTASTADLRAGKGVTGTGIAAGATIASVTNATTFELSAAATASGTVNLTFDTGIFEAGEFLGTVPLQTDISVFSGELGSGVTGGSGITALGTVATGNLSNTAIVYPAGHILGLQNTIMQGTQAIGTSLIDVTDGTTALEVSSTNTNASKFFITVQTYMGLDVDVGTHFELYYKIDSGSWTALGDANGNYGGGGSSRQSFMFAAAGDNDTWNRYVGTHCSGSFLWTPGSFSESVSIKVRAIGYTGTTYVGRNYNHNNSSVWAHSVPSTITMLEIK